MDDSFEACVGIVSSVAVEVSRGNGPSACDVLVGSSWGGAVAAAVIAEDKWPGPAILLCPALAMKERRCGASLHPTLSAAAVTARLAALPVQRKAALLLVH